MPSEERDLAMSLLEQWGWAPSRAMNVWAYFLAASLSVLRPGGRLAMVIPAELLQANYARELRGFLAKEFGAVVIVLIRGRIFPQLDQNVVLLLAEQGNPVPVQFVELEAAAAMGGMALPKCAGTSEDVPTGRWIRQLVPARYRDAMDRLPSIPGTVSLGDCASVDVGVVTGHNSFFVVTKDQARSLQAGHSVRKILCRTRELSGLTLTTRDWHAVEAGGRSRLITLDGSSSLSAPMEAYIAEGEEAGLPALYKCSIREPWYSVPSVWCPDAFLTRQFGTYPRLSINGANATCTDTILRVVFAPGVSGSAVSERFVNSMTLAHAELIGRRYGGGVLELMPSDAENLRIPEPGCSLPRRTRDEIDRLMRQGDLDGVLEITDEILLHEQLGLPRSAVRAYQRSRLALSAWRIGRGPSTRRPN
jgi:hypothetical protein